MDKRAKRALIDLATISFAVFLLFPIFFLVISSFKDVHQIFEFPPQIFFKPTFETYKNALTSGEWGRMFANSGMASAGATLIGLVLGLPVAFALAFRNIPRKNFTAFSLLGIKMLPPIVMLLPIYLLIRSIRLYNNILGLMLIYAIFTIPYIVWILNSFFQQIPIEILEAAQLDGASTTYVLLRILVPMVKEGLIVAIVFSILQGWNDFPIAFILTSYRGAATVPVGLSTLVSSRVIYWNVLFAVGVLNMIPALALALLVQKYWARGLTLGLAG